MSTLFFDSETTGIIPKGQKPGSPAHPHICQLGAQLVSGEGRVVAEINLLVKPNRWAIPAEATAVHGITTEMCEQFGLPIKTVMMLLVRLAQRAKRNVAHNRPFDFEMIWTELIRCELADELAFWLQTEGFCTMEASTPILNLPPTQRMIAAGYNKPKNPNLQEAYAFFTDGGTFDGAHDAMADTRAVRVIYEAIMQRAAQPLCLDE